MVRTYTGHSSHIDLDSGISSGRFTGDYDKASRAIGYKPYRPQDETEFKSPIALLDYPVTVPGLGTV